MPLELVLWGNPPIVGSCLRSGRMPKWVLLAVVDQQSVTMSPQLAKLLDRCRQLLDCSYYYYYVDPLLLLHASVLAMQTQQQQQQYSDYLQTGPEPPTEVNYPVADCFRFLERSQRCSEYPIHNILAPNPVILVGVRNFKRISTQSNKKNSRLNDRSPLTENPESFIVRG